VTKKSFMELTKNWERVTYFLFGMIVAFLLSQLTPLLSLPAFVVLVVLTLYLVLQIFQAKDLGHLRLMLLGASIVSISLAFISFISITHLGNISISLDQIVGLFRSILLASYFSFIERLMKFAEDERRKRKG